MSLSSMGLLLLEPGCGFANKASHATLPPAQDPSPAGQAQGPHSRALRDWFLSD